MADILCPSAERMEGWSRIVGFPLPNPATFNIARASWENALFESRAFANLRWFPTSFVTETAFRTRGKE